MKILVLGTNALPQYVCQKLLEDPEVEKVYHIPANEQIIPTGRYEPISTFSLKEFFNFIDEVTLDLVFITSINFGINEAIHKKLQEKGIPVASPSAGLTMLEWSKITGKKLLNELGIPTPGSKIYSKKDLIENYFSIPRPFVLKYEQDYRIGLQTLIITDDNYQEEFEILCEYGQIRHMHRVLGHFNDQHFIIEDFLEGKREYSYHILANKQGWQYLGTARDYKKFNNGDHGFNTAGMGAYSPVEINPIVHQYADKIVKHLIDKGTPYVGVLYLGIMEDKTGTPYVLEINARPGDPELQAILATIDQPISKLLYQTAKNEIIDEVTFNGKTGVCIRVVHNDYRNQMHLTTVKDYDPSVLITHPDFWPEIPNVCISFPSDRRLINSTITSSGNSRSDAANKLYKFLSNKRMYNFTYRTDVGYLE